MHTLAHRVALALLLAAPVVLAAQAAQERPAPLPATEQLLARVQANQYRIQEIRSDFICREVDDVDNYDDIDKVTRHHIEEYELSWRDNFPIRRMLARNGVPLTAAEWDKQEVAIEKQMHKQEKSKQAASSNTEDILEVFLRASLFSNARRESFKGRKVIAVDLHPNPHFSPHTGMESLIHTLGGTLWIDEEDAQAARLEAKLDDNFRIAGGMAANFNKHSSVLIEQQRIDDKIWLPSLTDINVQGRKVLYLSSVHQHVTQHFYGYHRFRSETRQALDTSTDHDKRNASRPAVTR